MLGEDKSDVEFLRNLIWRIADDKSIKILKKGYTGCAELLIKGAKQIQAYHKLGCRRFIICYDSDRTKAIERHREIIEKIVKPSNIQGVFCTLVPVQELESWILSDIKSVSKVITGWKPTINIPNPENTDDPKEYLEKLSRTAQQRPLYSHATHNPRVAEHICLKELSKKCPSSWPLFEIVKIGKGNHPSPTEAHQQEINEMVLSIRNSKT
ncbi:DUF4276 family protein [Janthinobacterium lividum]